MLLLLGLAWAVPATAAAPPTVRATLPSTAACEATYTQNEYIRYARRVYLERRKIKPPARQKLQKMLQCQGGNEQHAAKARHNVRLKRRAFKQRRAILLLAWKGDNRALGRIEAAKRGWTGSQWPCLESLWSRESGWNHRIANIRSGAYGIPQALPGSKMASHGSDWETNPVTQIRWGLSYIAGRYGTPCGASAFQSSNGWY